MSDKSPAVEAVQMRVAEAKEIREGEYKERKRLEKKIEQADNELANSIRLGVGVAVIAAGMMLLPAAVAAAPALLAGWAAIGGTLAVIGGGFLTGHVAKSLVKGPLRFRRGEQIANKEMNDYA